VVALKVDVEGAEVHTHAQQSAKILHP
jgi:hypothetical protein